MTSANESGRASIREVYSLLEGAEERILGAVSRVEERQIKQDGQIAELSKNLGSVEERLNNHINSHGHKVETERLDELKVTVANLGATVKIAAGMITSVGLALIGERIKNGG